MNIYKINHLQKITESAVLNRYVFCLLFLYLFSVNFSEAQDNWEQQYNELKQIIDKHYDEPPAETNDLGTFLYWIGTKGNELSRAKQMLDEANKLYITHPENQTYNEWVSKFLNLVKRAEDSGNLTVWLACVKLLRIREYDSGWIIPLWNVNQFGRKIYLKAKESGFSTIDPEQRSICLLNYSLGMLESDQKNENFSSGSGFSLYKGRQLLDGIPVSGGEALTIPDFLDTDCDGRKMFYRWTEGEPQKTIMYAFTNVDKIREECNWWGFGEIWQDATDLMNEYYEDALCKIPPHDMKLGHKYFLQLAEEKHLDRSIKYNKGFYGTLYGKVRILGDDGSTHPVSGAKVTVEDYDQTWTAKTDENGRYEIKKAILHKDCSPFDISATYKGDRVDDTYDGPLSKPDSTARFRKDLLIKPDKKYRWYGNLTAQLYENSKCSKNVLKDVTFQKVNLNIWAQHIDIYVPNNIVDNSDNIKVTGSVFGKVDYSYYMEGGDENHNKIEINQARGMHVFPITYENVQNILIISEKLTDENAMKQMEEMAKKMASGNYSIEEMEKITTQMGNRMSDDRKSFPVRVIIQLTGNWRGDKLVYEYVHETDNGKVVEDREFKDIIEADLAMPFTLELKGTCTKRDNGEINIHAEMHKLNNGPPCERSTANATFTLKRYVVKK